ncbi:MAG: HAMP domain-containing histidine kinase [Spirochaetales bacterium]|jgi:signal transduction histidine kinase|nr:HAMP domain-containing histidine kinase [Spirochaetales bacterium]
MTLKRRLFFLNFRAVLVTFFTMFLFAAIVNIAIVKEGEAPPTDAGFAALFLIFITATLINLLLTFRLIKNILNSLKFLSEGVRQIHGNNLAYRIAYNDNDEFRPVCEAFNEMAGRLEKFVAQRQKDEANRRDLIAGISHDLRTPLTSINGSLEGLEAGVASTPEMQRKYFERIRKKAADLERIIEQLFLFSKLDMDEFPLTIRRVDFALAVSDMIQETEDEYARRGLKLNLGEMRAGIFVDADVFGLRNVIINILENSVRYKTKEQGAVTITCTGGNAASFAELRLADDGPGVPAEKLEKLFDVFYRSDPSRSKKGSGIGLAISRKTIELMGGTIHAELPEAGGLAIVIRLPLKQKEIVP